LEVATREIDTNQIKIDNLLSKLSNNKKFQELKRILTQDQLVYRVVVKHLPDIEMHNITSMDVVKEIYNKLSDKLIKYKEDVVQLTNTITIRRQLFEQTKEEGLCMLCKSDLKGNDDFAELELC